jgi:hypothetical protein
MFHAFNQWLVYEQRKSKLLKGCRLPDKPAQLTYLKLVSFASGIILRVLPWSRIIFMWLPLWFKLFYVEHQAEAGAIGAALHFDQCCGSIIPDPAEFHSGSRILL